MNRVLITSIPDCENFYLLFSASRRDSELSVYQVKAHVSFFYDGGEYGAEWEPEHGPIQVWQRADSDGEDTLEHYFYPRVYNKPLNWSQLAVERAELPQAAVRGDWGYIRAVLKDWAAP